MPKKQLVEVLHNAQLINTNNKQHLCVHLLSKLT